MRNFLAVIVLLIAIVFWQGEIWAEKNTHDNVSNRYGLSMVLGNTCDPTNDISFLQVSGVALYDYDQIWPHSAPKPLRFKVEGSFGATARPQNHIMASVGMLALYYLDDFTSSRLRPYVEAGIGVIYTDFQVEGQGLRVNFNPQAGIGTEFLVDSGAHFFAAMRLHHISNGEFHEDNRGINSVILMFGRFF